MKWNDENTAKLKELVYAGKSNKEIAQTLEMNINDIYNKRSQLGITIDKVKSVVPAPDEEASVRSWEKIDIEIGKVLQSKKAAEKKIARCDKRLVELSEELQLSNKKRKIKG